MVDLRTGGALEAAAWKVRNLEDFEARLERAARRVDEIDRAHETAALVIFEAALTRSGRPIEEIRETVRRFEEAFADEEDELTIPRVSGILNVEGDSWFYDDPSIRTLAGQLLGQFQHRVTQYNYVSEREVLRRWADSYDTKLFIRRRIHETEPIVGVIEGVDLPLIQYLRAAAGGDTIVPSPRIARVLVALGALDEGDVGDDYAVLAAAEGLALRLELPAPIVGEMLTRLAAEDHLRFPEPPAPERPEESAEEAGDAAGATATGGGGAGGTDEEAEKPSAEDRAARKAARADARRGEEPTRVQDPQAKDAPGTAEEAGDKPEPAAPEAGAEDAPGKEG
jgi:hypothetical protein